MGEVREVGVDEFVAVGLDAGSDVLEVGLFGTGFDLVTDLLAAVVDLL